MSWRIVHLDLRAGAPPIEAGAEPVYAVFWWGTLPLGASGFAPEELPVGRARLLGVAAGMLSEQLAYRVAGTPRARSDGRPLPAHVLSELPDATAIDVALAGLDTQACGAAEDLSVVVCTRDRPDALRGCLAALTAQRPAAGEIVVVDNSEGRSARAVCGEFAAVRYVHEPRPGLSAARNTGIAACTRRLIAFTDDDVEVHPGWAAELVRAFASAPGADAVTGLVIPAALDSEAQRFFQFELGGFNTGYVPLRFDGEFFTENLSFGPQVWNIGAGANMAFRRAVFERLGGFDERLGAGASGCSEDSEMWYRILAAGGACLYEPRAVAFHHHRADWAGLRRQMRAYLRGHVAALVVQYDRYGHAGNLSRLASQIPAYFAATWYQTLKESQPERRGLLWEEVRGWLAGLLYLLRPRWRQRPGAAVPTRAAAEG